MGAYSYPTTRAKEGDQVKHKSLMHNVALSSSFVHLSKVVSLDLQLSDLVCLGIGMDGWDANIGMPVF